MPAQVQQCLYRGLPGTNNDDGFIAELIQEIIACFGDLAEVPGIVPGLHEKPVQFTPVDVAIPVEILLQGKAFRLVVNQLRYCCHPYTPRRYHS